MSPFPIPVFDPRRWRPVSVALLAAALLVQLPAAETPASPENPNPPAAPRPTVRRDALVTFFDSAHLQAHEAADVVAAIFGSVNAEGEVWSNAVAIFGHVTTARKVGGNVVSIGGDVNAQNEVGGNVVSIFGHVTIGPDVEVHGNVVSIGGRIHRDPSAVVHGNEVPLPIPGLRQFGGWIRDCLLYGRLYRHDARSTWVLIGFALVLSLLVAAIFRNTVDAGVGVLARRPGATFINGMLAAVLLPPALILITATGIGALIVPFLLIGVLFATWIGMLAVSRWCGAQLGLADAPALALVVGYLLFAALFAVPVIGLLFWSAVSMLGLGTAVTAYFESRRREARTTAPTSKRSPETAAHVPLQPAPPPPPPPPVPPAPFFAPENAGSALSGMTTPTVPPPPAAPPPIDPAAASPAPAGSPPAPQPPPLAAAQSDQPDEMAERADFWARLAATLLDLIVVGVVLGMTGLPVAFPFAALVYFVAFWAWRATTLGGAVMSLRLARLDGRRIDVGVALVRAFGAIMSLIPAGLGFLWVLWDPEKQSWHDKIAGTTVVRTPRGQGLI